LIYFYYYSNNYNKKEEKYILTFINWFLIHWKTVFVWISCNFELLCISDMNFTQNLLPVLFPPLLSGVIRDSTVCCHRIGTKFKHVRSTRLMNGFNKSHIYFVKLLFYNFNENCFSISLLLHTFDIASKACYFTKRILQVNSSYE